MNPLLQLDNQLCFALYAATRAIMQAYQPLLEPLGLTYPQYLVMLVLWEEGETSLKRMSHRLRFDAGTLTPLLDRMEMAGLLHRMHDPADERSVHIALTDAGLALRDQADGIPTSMMCGIRLPADQIHRLRDELHQLTHNLVGEEDV